MVRRRRYAHEDPPVSEDLIALTPELSVETSCTRIRCQAGKQFGSRYPGDPRCMALHDFLPDEQLQDVWNLHYQAAATSTLGEPPPASNPGAGGKATH